MDQPTIVRFELGTSHGWYIGRTEQWGLLPGDETAWSDQWQRYCETSGNALTDLRFQRDEYRYEFVRDVGL